MCCKRYHIILPTFSVKFKCKICVEKEVIQNLKITFWSRDQLRSSGLKNQITIILFKIWPTDRFSKAKSYYFHFYKSDVTWPLSANGLFSRWRFAIWDPGLLLTKSGSSTSDLGRRLNVLLAIWVSATPGVCVRKNLYCLSKDDYLWRKACERTSFGPKESEEVVFVLRLNDMKCEKN